MDFFHAQDLARRNTNRLVVFFICAVLSLIIFTNLLVMVLFGFLDDSGAGLTLAGIAAQFDWPTFLMIGSAVSLIILGGSAYKTMALRGGGNTLAQTLGGRLINQHTTDLHERKALNVVEEMAIASGTPVPPVYVLESEQGINAFAAGFMPRDAVIGLTRGTITHLSREELQGVVGHEFSHILNGDMRLNMRLIGILHGILLIGLIGYYLLRSVRHGSRKNSGPILGLGLGLIVIGYTGTFFGNLIKASVSRQREFLADASAVQFTRSKEGIAGALKKIGGYPLGSTLETPHAPAMSHGYFCNGVSSLVQSIFATHPPLDVRIKRLDPRWDGVFEPVTAEVDDGPEALRQTPHGLTSNARASQENATHNAAAGMLVAAQIMNNVGRTSSEHLAYAQSLVQDIPDTIRAAVHEPYGARAVIYCLVMDRKSDILEAQLQQLKTFGDDGIVVLVEKLLEPVQQLHVRFRLPLIDMALPSLRLLSAPQYQRFKDNLQFLMRADSRIDLFEWSLQHILFHHLNATFERPRAKAGKFTSIEAAAAPISVLISMLVYGCVEDKNLIDGALASAKNELGLRNLTLVPQAQVTIDNLGAAVDNLALLMPLLKPRLLKACLAVITQDKDYAPNEMELMRALADALDCPLPPYLGQ